MLLKPMLRTSDGGVVAKVFRRGQNSDEVVEVGLVVGAGAVDPPPAPDPTPSGTPVDRLLGMKPFYVAHRLGGSDYPEHTIAGLKASIAAGYKAFEFSTYRSSDGAYVGSHDWTTERTTGVRHEIWNTDWATLTQLQQQAGPLIRLQDAVAAMPVDGVLVLDHKTTSASASMNAGDLASEAALFDLLDSLFEKPQERVIWKCFAGASSAERARAKGYKVMCMLYPAEVAGADFSRWDVLGMEYSAAQSVWDTLRATGKPTIAHIIYSPAQAQTGLSKGAQGLMSSVPISVRP